MPIMHQDNKSAILLEENGSKLSSKRTKHINIHYYFIMDCTNNNELTVKYCPTDDMVGDFFSEPLQGKKFINFRKTIVNL